MYSLPDGDNVFEYANKQLRKKIDVVAFFTFKDTLFGILDGPVVHFWKAVHILYNIVNMKAFRMRNKIA